MNIDSSFLCPCNSDSCVFGVSCGVRLSHVNTASQEDLEGIVLNLAQYLGIKDDQKHVSGM